MANVIGYNNTNEKEHRLINSLDGNLSLRIYVDAAKGKTTVRVNDSVQCESDAGDYTAPYYCGDIAIPRGEFTLKIDSGCEISKIVLGENLYISSSEEFELHYANRIGQWVFRRPKPKYTPETIGLLRRHGFLFQEPEDCSYGKMPSGVPLGGFGCGKLEIGDDGMFTAFTGNNNQDSPIYRMPGSFIALAANNLVRILRKDPLELPYQPFGTITADHEFPFARIQASDPELPIVLSLEAFSPHIPGNAADSALPCIFFEISLANVSESYVEAALCFSWENIINTGGSMTVTNKGERLFPLCFHTWNGSFVWSDRRVNRCEREGNGLVFSASDDRGNPMSFGTHLLRCDDKDAEAVLNRSILPDDEKSFVDHLCKNTDFYATDTDTEFRAGAWIVRKKLAPHGRETVRFILAWYMPSLLDADGNNPGVEYTNRFGSVKDVMDYAAANRNRLYQETKEINDIINRSTLPDWFKRRLLDDRFPTVTCSWYDRNGYFSINEAPTGMGGCLGTLDQRTASQCYYTSFYPELDAIELDLFRRAQRADGLCAHEIGFAAIKPEARPVTQWPDLAASYIIQVYHYYQRTGDKAMLDLHWPHIKKAVEWTRTLDDENTAIPYLCPGRGSTFDNQIWEGISSFIATMQIAAYRIGAACAELEGELDLAAEWIGQAEKAEKFRMECLWNHEKGYFNNAYNIKEKKVDDSCFIASLAGDWALERAAIGTHIGLEGMNRVSAVITEQCVGDNGLTDQGGRKDTTPGFLQYSLAYLASAALYAGNDASAWRVISTTEKVITNPDCSTHFNQALTYKYDGTRFGLPYYMTAPASWNVLEAIVGLRADIGKGILSFKPTGECEMKIPVFLPDAWFLLERSADGRNLTLSPLKSIRSCTVTSLSIYGKWDVDNLDSKYEDGYTIFAVRYDPGKDTLKCILE
jgi:hypothetical protein